MFYKDLEQSLVPLLSCTTAAVHVVLGVWALNVAPICKSMSHTEESLEHVPAGMKRRCSCSVGNRSQTLQPARSPSIQVIRQKYSRAKNECQQTSGHMILTAYAALMCRNLRVWVIPVCHSWPFKWLATKKCQCLCTTELEWSVYNLNWAYAWDGTRELWVTVSYSWASNAVWEWLGPLSAHDMDICRLCRRIIPKSVCKDARYYTDASRI